MMVASVSQLWYPSPTCALPSPVRRVLLAYSGQIAARTDGGSAPWRLGAGRRASSCGGGSLGAEGAHVCRGAEASLERREQLTLHSTLHQARQGRRPLAPRVARTVEIGKARAYASLEASELVSPAPTAWVHPSFAAPKAFEQPTKRRLCMHVHEPLGAGSGGRRVPKRGQPGGGAAGDGA